GLRAHGARRPTTETVHQFLRLGSRHAGHGPRENERLTRQRSLRRGLSLLGPDSGREQVVDQLTAVAVEEEAERASHVLPHALHLQQLLDGGTSKAVERSELT